MKLSEKEIQDWGLENFYSLNALAQPSKVKVFRGRATYFGFGKWIAYITDDGTINGNPLVSELENPSKAICIPSVSRDTTNVALAPFISVDQLIGNIILFNVVESKTSLPPFTGVVVDSLEFSNAPLIVHYLLVYYEY